MAAGIVDKRYCNKVYGNKLIHAKNSQPRYNNNSKLYC